MILFHIFYTLPLVIGIIGMCVALYKDIQDGWLHTISPKNICEVIGVVLLCFIPIMNIFMASLAPTAIWGDDFYNKIENWYNTPFKKYQK